MGKSRALFYQVAAALVFAVTLLLVNPNVESGMNDDWSFVRTVQDLAASGQLKYNGWSAPLLGFQAYWGALFVHVFGFSFLTVRASSWTLTLLSIPVLWSLLRRAELSESQAFFGLLAFLLSPLNLPNLATFMTDMPAFLLFAAALLAALKAWDSSATLCIGVSTVCGMLSGSVRQIYWLSSICFLIALALFRVKSLRGRALIASCISVTGLFGAFCSHWLSLQPYVPSDDMLHAWRTLPKHELLETLATEMMRGAISTAVLSLPFSLPLAFSQLRRLAWWKHVVLLPAAIASAIHYAAPLPWLGNTITKYGVLLPTTTSVGDRAELLASPFVIFLAALGLGSGVYALCGVPFKRSPLALLTLPFAATYLLVLALRAPEFGLYDRYTIPTIFVFGTLLQRCAPVRHRSIAWLTFACFAMYAIATTHDYFAEARAKLAATNQILRAGHARTDVLSGFEYDMWTQMEHAHYINNHLLERPPGAYREMEDCNGDDDLQSWWRPMAPALNARYVVSIAPVNSLKPANFPDIEYWRWLPPHKARVWVSQVDAKDPPLTCKLGSGE